MNRWRLYLTEANPPGAGAGPMPDPSEWEISPDPPSSSKDEEEEDIDISAQATKVPQPEPVDIEPDPTVAGPLDDTLEQQETRNKIYNAYESGTTREVYEKYLKRQADQGKIDIPADVTVSDYYDQEILPRIKDHVYKTPVYPMPDDTGEYPQAYYVPGSPGNMDPKYDREEGEIYKSALYHDKPGRKKEWEEETFPHELAHGVQKVVPEPDRRRGGAHDMASRQLDDFKILFPSILTQKQRDDYGRPYHHKRSEEIHDAIILSRIKDLPGQAGRLLTADDINYLRKGPSWWERQFGGPSELEKVQDSDLGRALRDKTFLNPNLTDQEIADIINRIAKAKEKGPKRSSMA